MPRRPLDLASKPARPVAKANKIVFSYLHVLNRNVDLILWAKSIRGWHNDIWSCALCKTYCITCNIVIFYFSTLFLAVVFKLNCTWAAQSYHQQLIMLIWSNVYIFSEVIIYTLPVIKLEMMSGRINIFSILIRMSPGKAITMTMSGWIGEATRSKHPNTAPRITPEVQERVLVSETASVYDSKLEKNQEWNPVENHILQIDIKKESISYRCIMFNSYTLDIINEIVNRLSFFLLKTLNNSLLYCQFRC